jgi:uncharacterized protein YegP (UPF0339 family)
MALSDLELRLESSNDKDQPFMVRLYDIGKDPERKIAYSETYTQKAGGRNMAQAVIDGDYEYQTFRGTDGKWYWRLRGLNGERLARSSASYESKSDAGWREAWLEKHRSNGVLIEKA